MSIKASEQHNQDKQPPKLHAEPQMREQRRSSLNSFHLVMQRKTIIKPSAVTGSTTYIAKKSKAFEKPLKTKKQHLETSEITTVKESDVSSSLVHVQTPTGIDRSRENDPNIIAQSSIASGRADNINLLIKKLTLNFHAKQNEAKFSIASGIFQGAQFSLVSENQDLHLHVQNASASARHLLVEHESELKNILADRAINLRDVTFLS